MLKIRLARGGAKKRPYYHIVIADSHSPRDGKFIEKIGTYNPLLAKDSPDRIKLDNDRAAHWLKMGAQPTDRVLRFLDGAGIAKREARNPSPVEDEDEGEDEGRDTGAVEVEAEVDRA